MMFSYSIKSLFLLNKKRVEFTRVVWTRKGCTPHQDRTLVKNQDTPGDRVVSGHSKKLKLLVVESTHHYTIKPYYSDEESPGEVKLSLYNLSNFYCVQ